MQLGSAAVETTRWLDAYGRMLLIRHFENEMQRLFLKGEVHGTTHLAAGQEAVPVGVCMALEPDDYVAGTYRGHGHALAKGTDPAALAAEMLGRAGGVCGGRAGSMNVIDLEHGLVGCYGIVGRQHRRGHRRRAERQAPGPRGGRLLRRRRHEPGVLPRVPELRRRALAAGRLRLREQLLRRVHADAEGHRRARHRGARLRLRHPRPRSSTATTCGRSRAPPREAVAHARGEHAPTLLECQTYRHYGHSKSDPATYRPKEEVERWLERDPLKLTRERLLEMGADVEAAEREAREAMDRAVEAALASPYPEPGGATEYAA